MSLVVTMGHDRSRSLVGVAVVGLLGQEPRRPYEDPEPDRQGDSRQRVRQRCQADDEACARAAILKDRSSVAASCRPRSSEAAPGTTLAASLQRVKAALAPRVLAATESG